jgi:hypothetical protein
MAAPAAMAQGERRNTAAQAESLRHLGCGLIGIAGGFGREEQTQNWTPNRNFDFPDSGLSEFSTIAVSNASLAAA